MGIDIRLIDENEKIISELIDHNNLTKPVVHLADKEISVCLKFIDQFGDTLFNRLQIPILAEEISVIRNSVQTEDLKLHCSRILDLISKAELHMYVKFYGD